MGQKELRAESTQAVRVPFLLWEAATSIPVDAVLLEPPAPRALPAQGTAELLSPPAAPHHLPLPPATRIQSSGWGEEGAPNKDVIYSVIAACLFSTAAAFAALAEVQGMHKQ